MPVSCAPRRSRGFVKASALSVKSGLQANAPSSPLPEIGIGDDQPITVDLEFALEVAGARFIEISFALLEACVALRVAHDCECREIDEGGGDRGTPPGGKRQAPDR